MSNLENIDGIVVDTDTGEIIEGELFPDMIEHWQRQHRLAYDSIEGWESRKRAIGFILTRLLHGSSFKSEYGSTVVVSEGRRTVAHVPDLQLAQQLELLTHDQVAQLALEAVKELDPKALAAALERMFADDPDRLEKVRATVLREQKRSGYVFTKPPALPVPERVAVAL